MHTGVCLHAPSHRAHRMAVGQEVEGEKLGARRCRESVEDKENENPKNFNEMPVE